MFNKCIMMLFKCQFPPVALNDGSMVLDFHFCTYIIKQRAL